MSLRKFILLIPILMIFISGCVQEQPIGGQTDDKGCLVAAGYTWCESRRECLRTWEVDCPSVMLTPEECEDRSGRIHNIAGSGDCYGNETAIAGVSGFISPNFCCISKELACTDGGGTVARALCCSSVDDYPNTCIIGACGCAPDSSREVNICDCGEGRCFDGNGCVNEVVDFDTCVNAGYLVMESMPRQCSTPGGEVFTEDVNLCTSPEGNSMILEDAKKIALASECVDEGPLTEYYLCNSFTGTWWFDMDVEKAGCNPACVVDIETREAEINWRCTGAIPD